MQKDYWRISEIWSLKIRSRKLIWTDIVRDFETKFTEDVDSHVAFPHRYIVRMKGEGGPPGEGNLESECEEQGPAYIS